ncbi:MAG: protein BatD [candidate division Zixibacteria bacterium]|nr:protein BatD [candidate division Zixibacteria bacterium]
MTLTKNNCHSFIPFVVILFLLAVPNLILAEVTVTANVDRTELHENETVSFTITIGGDAVDIPDISLPDLPGFTIYSSGTTKNFSYVNGRMETSKQFSFTLLPTRTGILQIPSMSLAIDGKTYTTPTFEITVPKGGAAQTRSNTPSTQRERRSQPQRRQVGPEDLFITTAVDKDTVYVNEQVTLSFKFHQGEGVDILQNPDYKPPQKTGFWVEDLPPRQTGYKTIDNRRYHVTEIKTGLFPTTSGEQMIGSAELTVKVREPRRHDPFSFFDRDLSGFFGRSRTLSLKSDPIKIVTLPLPAAGRPDDFGGAVGGYRIKAVADKNRVEVNEPITLKVKISGTGNIKSVASPEIPELPDFRIYQSGDSENISKTAYRVGGSKTFEHVFIPKRAGTYLLPAISFSFFDPRARTYQTVVTAPIQIEVTPAKERYVSQMQNLDANKIDLVARDIRYLKSDIGNLNGSKNVLLALNPFSLALFSVPVIGYLVVIGSQRRRERLLTDQSYRRLKQARKMAAKKLARAKKFLLADDPDAFYLETNRSMLEYFADRFNLPAYGLTTDKIREYAQDRLDQSLVIRLVDLLQQGDFGRFAPAGRDREQMECLWQDARNLIIELEKSR